MTTSLISLPMFLSVAQRTQTAETRNAAVEAIGDARGESAWLREMEREQMQGWLDNSVTPQQQTARPALNNPAIDVIARGADFEQIQLSGASIASGYGRTQNGVREALNSYRQSSAGFFPETNADSTAEGEKLLITQRLADLVERKLTRSKPVANEAEIESSIDDAVDPEESQTNAASTQDEADTAPGPRISVQWFGNNINIWIGAGKRDGLSSGDLEHLLQESKSLLASEGCQLLSMTCNGEVIYNNSPNQES